MHTATYLVILATVASLAHTVTLRDEKKEGEETTAAKEGEQATPAKEELKPLSVQCCMPEKVVPSIFKSGTQQVCMESLLEQHPKPEDFAIAAEKACMVECILGESGLLNEDKSIKEQDFRKLFMDNAHSTARTEVNNALDKCFERHNKKTDHGPTCKSGAQKLFGCIQSEILVNCPETMWNPVKEKCRTKLNIAVDEAESKEKLESAEDDAESEQ